VVLVVPRHLLDQHPTPDVLENDEVGDEIEETAFVESAL